MVLCPFSMLTGGPPCGQSQQVTLCDRGRGLVQNRPLTSAADPDQETDPGSVTLLNHSEVRTTHGSDEEHQLSE